MKRLYKNLIGLSLSENFSVARTLVLSLSVVLISVGCGKGESGFSILPDSQAFKQGVSINNKVDVLFVIDNSGSMSPSQNNMVTNYSAFIQRFIQKGYDFRIGVTTTDAYLALFNSAYASMARLKDGNTTRSGVYVINPSTPNIESTFLINASQGSAGYADERAFSSFEAALSSNLNGDFRRPEAFLAIVILSDEDDFSTTALYHNSDHNYNESNLRPISYYTNYLDTLTNSSGATRRYSVSAITALDQTCASSLYASTIVGTRYMQLVDATSGVLGSICDASFANSLDSISSRIAELSTQFFLGREPDPASIKVIVSGVVVPQSATNGWTYQANSMSIIFHGAAIPPQGATIVVDFQPVAPKQ